MKVVVVVLFALVGIVEPMVQASAQQNSGASSAVQCTTEMSKEECEVSQFDALLNKADQASATKDAADTGPPNDPVQRYMLAIQHAVMKNWLRPDFLPNAECKVQVVQLPGGDVLSATVDSSCPYTEVVRQSVVNAVLRTKTLPYKGFENVFQRSITLVFIPWQSDEARAGLPSVPGASPQTFGSRPAGIDTDYRIAHPVNYPPEAVSKHHEGRVDVLVLVGAEGQVINAQLRRSSGFGELDMAALDAAKSWRYTASYQGMAPVPSYADVPVVFSLSKPVSSFPNGWKLTCHNSDHTINDSRIAAPDCTVSDDLLGASDGTFIHSGSTHAWRLIGRYMAYDLYADEGSAMHIGTTVGLWTKMMFRTLQSTVTDKTRFQISIQQGTYDCQAESFMYGMAWRYDSFGHPVSIGPSGIPSKFVEPQLTGLFTPLCESERHGGA